MATFRFPGYPAVDPSTNQVVRDAVGQVYAVTDTTFSTPLTVTDLSGVPMTSVKVGPLGVTEQFVTTDQPEVNWKSGSFVIYLWSPMSMIEATQSASASAALSASAAEASRQAAIQALAESSGVATFIPNTAEGWAVSTVVLLPDQPGYATNTGEIRVGNGSSTWSGLPAWGGSGGGTASVDTLLGTGATGRNVMKAADQTTARAAIGAGTSSLVIGTGATNAKAGNWQPAVAEVTGLGVELTNRELLIRWQPGVGWPARPATYPFGALFISTNDPAAPAPSDAALQPGDVWRRHPNAS